jgi:26S proteasome regulatory subunit N1
LRVLAEEKKAVEVDPKKGAKGKDGKKKTKKELAEEEAELSEEDQLLKDTLDMAVKRAEETDEGVRKLAFETLRNEICAATSTMTSVPKPLKFLRPHYDTLEALYGRMVAGEVKKELADIMSVLAMTMTAPELHKAMEFKLEGNPLDMGAWGHEYVRHMAGELAHEHEEKSTKAENTDAVMAMVDIVVPFYIKHNSEPEAVDLLIEVQQVEKILTTEGVDEGNVDRICKYLLSTAPYTSDEDELKAFLSTSFELYRRTGALPNALRVALMMEDMTLIESLFKECDDTSVKKQMGYMLGRQRVNFDYEDEDEEVNEIISNTALSEQFLNLARELDVLEPKTPEDIYKSHLSETNSLMNRRSAGGAAPVDSARQNLASTFVNAFVNAGFGQDKLMTPEGNKWLYKNKDHGMMSAAASLGMILQWNVEEGLTQIDKFLYSSEEYVKAGAVLAVGIVSSGVRNDCDPALALLSEHVSGDSTIMKQAAAVGLGLAYAGSAREDVAEFLTPLVADTGEKASMLEVSLAALSLGMIYVGTCDEEVGSTLMQRLMESTDAELDQTASRYLCLAMGLLFLGKQEKADAMLEAVKTVEHKMGAYAAITLETCAYAGTGNVLHVQHMLHICAEYLRVSADKAKEEKEGEKKEGEEEEAKEGEDKKEEDEIAGETHQTIAVLGIALICMGESVGSQMAMRSFDHLLQYGEKPIRQGVPLALALMNISRPDFGAIDVISRLTHDQDIKTAECAILALGLVGAGTNNSRIAGLLRQLSEFYAREPNPLFMVRLAQGLLHAGKGLMTLHPFHSDRLLLSPVALGGILTVLHSAVDLKNTILDKLHYLMYFLVCAMVPRMLITLDESGEPLPVTVRVGQAVDTVGQAGKPRGITGFQTHTTPVLLGVGDRAELGTEEYITKTPILEGFVILVKNPDYVPDVLDSAA